MLKLAVLAIAVLLPQEKNEAEELFKKMEAKVVGAKTVQLKLEGNMEPMEFKIKGELWFGEGGRVKLDLEGKTADMVRSISLVSDGSTIHVSGGDDQKSFKAPETFSRLMRTCFARVGFLGSVDGSDSETKAGTEPAEAFTVSDFKMGAKEKVGERSAQAIEFTATKKNDKDTASMTLWIDVETQLPLKRTLTMGGRILNESYSGLKLDERIDAAKFEVPKEKDKEKK